MDINKVIMESIKDITNKDDKSEVVTEAASAVRIPKAGEKDPKYIPALRKAFNSFPKHGKNLDVAGKGQTPPPTPADQKALDAKYREVRAEMDSPVAKVTTPVKAAAQKAGSKLSKALGAVKGAGSSALKTVTDNPKTSAAVAAALAAGVGAVAFRKKIAQAYKDAKKKLTEEKK